MVSPAVVVGTGPGAESDLDAVLTDTPNAVVIAVNRAVTRCPVPITHAVSMHPDHIAEEVSKLSYKVMTHSHMRADQCWKFDHPWMELTSGIYAIKIAKELGYSPVYVAGIPLSKPYNDIITKQNLLKIKKELADVVVPDHYWWKEILN